MRAFIAIELPKEIKNTLSSLQDELKSTGADVKWVASQNIHLTLKFLGEVTDEKLDKITKVFEQIAANNNVFKMRIYSVGAFPKINYPRVIWVGIDKGDNETKELAKELEEDLQKLGFLKEKRAFSSHITIGRVRSPYNRQNLVNALKRLENIFKEKGLEFEINKITFFKSTLTPKGPIYEALNTANLKTT